MKSKTINRFAITVASGLVILLSSCSNELFSQARKLSSTSDGLKNIFPVLAKDYVDSCFRRANYTLLVVPGQRQGRDVFHFRNTALQACIPPTAKDGSSIIEVASQAFITQNNVIAGHLEAIAVLSQKETFDFSSESGSLTDIVSRAASELGGATISDTKKTAIKSVVGFLFKVIAKDIARDALKEEIPKVNSSYQTVICFLRKDFDKIYRDSLRQEETQLNQYYESSIRLTLQRTSSEFDFNQLQAEKLRRELFDQSLRQNEVPTLFGPVREVEVIYDEWRKKQAELRNRYSALDGYLRILDTISTGHETLAQIAEGKTPRDLDSNNMPQKKESIDMETCEPKLVTKASKKSEGNDSELQLEILSQYVRTMEEQLSELKENQFIAQKSEEN